MSISEFNRLFGSTDLQLIDQILKGRYQPSMRLLDAGCGEGRNLSYFVRSGLDTWGVDTNPTALRLLRLRGKAWGPAFDPEKFVEADVAELPFPPTSFDAVICCAVLHFARDEEHFCEMVAELVRVLRPGGSLFVRTATGSVVNDEPPNAYPEASSYFLLTPQLTKRLTEGQALTWLEPQRTEQIAGQTAQSTLILKRN